MALAPENALAHTFLGEAYLDTQRIEDAERELHLAVELAPQLPQPHRNLAYSYAAQGSN